MKPLAKSKIVFINPEIINEEKIFQKRLKPPGTKAGRAVFLPGIWGEVRRKRLSGVFLFWMKRAQNMYSNSKGFVKTIIQHEVDHLNEFLFTETRVLNRGRRSLQSLTKTKKAKTSSKK